MEIELIPTLSLTTPVYVIVCVCDDVVKVTVESLTVNDEIVGAWSSVFVIVTDLTEIYIVLFFFWRTCNNYK